LNAYHVHDFLCEKDEDNCLIRQIDKGFSGYKMNKTSKTKVNNLKEKDLHCMNKNWYIKSYIHFVLLVSRYVLGTLSVKILYF